MWPAALAVQQAATTKEIDAFSLFSLLALRDDELAPAFRG